MRLTPPFLARWLGSWGTRIPGVSVRRLVCPRAEMLIDRDVQLWTAETDTQRERYGTRLLVMLDGQNAAKWRVAEAIGQLALQGVHLAIVAVPSSRERIDEMGMAASLDFAGRGRLAAHFQDYVVRNVLPAAQHQLGIEAVRERTGIFGASLGGLCALDTAWRHPAVFSHAGIFSGALWWRSDDSGAAAQQASRLMHRQIRATSRKPDLRLWFQAGTRDETSDRDGNGVIDAIQDTQELLAELAAKGFRSPQDIDFVKVQGGTHDETTWAGVLPAFLRWSCGSSGVG